MTHYVERGIINSYYLFLPSYFFSEMSFFLVKCHFFMNTVQPKKENSFGSILCSKRCKNEKRWHGKGMRIPFLSLVWNTRGRKIFRI